MSRSKIQVDQIRVAPDTVDLQSWSGPGDMRHFTTYHSAGGKSIEERMQFQVRREEIGSPPPMGFYSSNVYKGAAAEGGPIVLVELLNNPGRDRLVRVVKQFWFVDSKGRLWRVPNDLISDGTSIPRLLWWIIGPPFTGDYRRGALVHDAACQRLRKGREGYRADEVLGRLTGDRPPPPLLPDYYFNPRDVHRAFYDAMTADGMDGWQRYVMWQAVDRWGPQGADRK